MRELCDGLDTGTGCAARRGTETADVSFVQCAPSLHPYPRPLYARSPSPALSPRRGSTLWAGVAGLLGAEKVDGGHYLAQAVQQRVRLAHGIQLGLLAPQLVTLLDPKRENNCGIAMAHIKIPHAQVVAALLALDPGMMDHDPDEQANLQVRTQAAIACDVWGKFDRLLVIAEWRSCKHAARPMRSGRYWNITMTGTHPAPRITCVRWTPCSWS